MTRLVDGLERDGYVLRDPDPDDARAVRVRATEPGIVALTHGRERRVAAFSDLLRSLPHRDLTALRRGVEALERALASGG